MPDKEIIQQDLSGGSNIVTNPYDIAQKQSILLTNLLMGEHGSLVVRDGALILGTAPEPRPIVKLYDFVRQETDTAGGGGGSVGQPPVPPAGTSVPPVIGGPSGPPDGGGDGPDGDGGDGGDGGGGEGGGGGDGDGGGGGGESG
jgi:hypothetical protein